MKKKILWILLSFLLVASLVLASCAKEEVVEEEEEEEEVIVEEEEEEVEVVVSPVGEPQRGGTFTYLSLGTTWGEPQNPDIGSGSGGRAFQMLHIIQEMPFVGDIEKYGPRGTGEFAFNLQSFVPQEFMTGRLLESWEVSRDKLTWHVRPGVYWAPNEEQSAWMEARELIADDVVADLLYLREAPGGKSLKKFSGEIYATGRYTLVIELNYYESEWFYIIGYEDRANISPPEMITAGASKWKNQVGTGPFIFKEYVVGSYMSFSRNPNWWKTTTINGVEYSLPFIDELVIPVIPDESTRVAVLRTGTADAYASVLPPYWPTLKETAPGLLSASHLGEGRTLGLRCDQPPFDNVDLRRALMVGTDLKAFGDLQGAGSLPIHFYPTSEVNPTVYTPLEELPAETRLLFDYNPTLAKQMLADAGYPAGLELTCNIGTSAEHQDIGALLKDQWTKIGVTVNLNTVEQAAFDAMGRAVTYDDTIVGKFDIANPYFGIYKRARSRPLGIFNQAAWSNEYFDELMDVVAAAMDPADRSLAYKEAAIILIDEVPYIPLTSCPRRHYWWPWVKNYYGEWNVQDNPDTYPFAFAWIDQDLKKEMGY